MTQISELQPKALWHIFDLMTQVARPSKHEEKVVQLIESFCDQNKLAHRRDPVGNLIISKPATQGMENRKGVVMQGHVDMVPQKNADSNHDFLTDPIKTYIDGDWVSAEGTTLGADNGIGVAAALAVLASDDLVHGPLEVLLTIDEEAGMTGAKGLQAGFLEADILLNLDTEDEGELYVGCAGGVDVTAEFSVELEALDNPNQHKAFEIAVKGLRGGHSGLDIDKGRGNANKIINRFLLEAAEQKLEIKVASFNGGNLRNAIPRESFTQVVVNKADEIKFLSLLECFSQTAIEELGSVESHLHISAKSISIPSLTLSQSDTQKIVRSVAACVNGVTRMSQSFDGVVETSNNLAVVVLQENKVKVKNLIRSLSNSARDDLARSIKALFELAGASTTISGDYPGWKPKADSDILKLMIAGFERLYNKTPEVKVIHAGLECGLLGEPYPHWDMISFGPTIRHAHSPDEKVHIPSVAVFWEWLVDTLAHIPKK